MKIDRHGRAKILTPEEIQLLFNEGLQTHRDLALFGICLYTACQIQEACTLRRADVYDANRRVRPELIIREKPIPKASWRRARFGWARSCVLYWLTTTPHPINGFCFQVGMATDTLTQIPLLVYYEKPAKQLA